MIAFFVSTDMHTTVKAMAQIHRDRTIHVKEVAACGAATESRHISRDSNQYDPDPEKHSGDAIRLAEMQHQPHHGDIDHHQQQHKHAAPAQGFHLCSKVTFFS